MEHQADQSAADQRLELGDGDKTQLVTVAPKKPSRIISLKKLRSYKLKEVDAEELAADDRVDLVQKINKLIKDDAIARLLEFEERHEKTFFEIGDVLSAIQKQQGGLPPTWSRKPTRGLCSSTVEVVQPAGRGPRSCGGHVGV